MVRRSELACRDDWSRSLWQPNTGGQDEVEPQFSRSPLAGPVPPASQKDLTALLAQDIVSSGVSGEDVLLSEARIISEPVETENRWEPPARAIQVPSFDPRTAIFRAREAYRDKVKAKATEARMMTSADPIVEPVGERVTTATETFARVVENEPLATRLPESPAIQKPMAAIEPTQSSMAPVAAAAPSTRSPAVDRPRATRNASHNGTGSPARKRAEELLSQSAIESAMQERAPEPLPQRASEESMVEAPLALGLPEWYRTDLPRVCRTCRDFRPSAEGMRGWCANSWAFTHRRLVQNDDPAPCHSAIGDWWAPVDDVWLVAADVSSHSRSTPLLDRISGQESARRRRS
jgi:hypothetical protein